MEWSVWLQCTDTGNIIYIYISTQITYTTLHTNIRSHTQRWTVTVNRYREPSPWTVTVNYYRELLPWTATVNRYSELLPWSATVNRLSSEHCLKFTYISHLQTISKIQTDRSRWMSRECSQTNLYIYCRHTAQIEQKVILNTYAQRKSDKPFYLFYSQNMECKSPIIPVMHLKL